MKIWARIRKDNKTIDQYTLEVPVKSAVEVDDWNSPLGEICHALNLSRPVILEKHINELLRFNGTVFRADDFLEKISFDKLEIELF